MKPAFWAHSGSAGDRSDWQLLPEHLVETARLAAERGRLLGLRRSAELAGLVHDLGKYDPEFGRVLCGEPVRVDHSTAGGAVLLDAAGPQKPVAELLAYCVLGHHAGLPDKSSATDACLDRRIETYRDRLDPVWHEAVSVDLAPVAPEIMGRIRPGSAFDLSVAVRMIFSCLVDADFRDTEAFYARLEKRQVDRGWPALQDLLPRLAAAFEAKVVVRRGIRTPLLG